VQCTITFLNPKEVYFFRSSIGLLQAKIDHTYYKRITISRLFPLTKPWEYLSVRTSDDQELGIFKSLEGLPLEGRQEIMKELDKYN